MSLDRDDVSDLRRAVADLLDAATIAASGRPRPATTSSFPLAMRSFTSCGDRGLLDFYASTTCDQRRTMLPARQPVAAELQTCRSAITTRLIDRADRLVHHQTVRQTRDRPSPRRPSVRHVRLDYELGSAPSSRAGNPAGRRNPIGEAEANISDGCIVNDLVRRAISRPGIPSRSRPFLAKSFATTGSPGS